jgi:hypothetical protein
MTNSEQEHAARWAMLDARKERPKKRPCIWDRVDFTAHDTHADLGIRPLQRIRNLGAIGL